MHLENCQLGWGVNVELHGCGEGGGGGVERVPATAGDQRGVQHLATYRWITLVTSFEPSQLFADDIYLTD